jgi:hypothetical protein
MEVVSNAAVRAQNSAITPTDVLTKPDAARKERNKPI